MDTPHTNTTSFTVNSENNNEMKDKEHNTTHTDHKTGKNNGRAKGEHIGAEWKVHNGDVEASVGLLPGNDTIFQEKKIDIEYDDWSDDENDGDDFEGKKSNLVGKVVVTVQQAFLRGFTWLKLKTRGYLVPIILLAAYFVYFVLAMLYEFGTEPSVRLLACTILGLVIMTRHRVYRLVAMVTIKLYGSDELSDSARERLTCVRFFLRWAMYGLVVGLIIWVLIVQGIKNPTNLRSVPGLFIFCLVALLFSTNPARVNWHTVFWGIGLQFLASLAVLKFTMGHDAIMWIQGRLDEFFANTQAAAVLMFGESYKDHYMVFGGLPIIFLSNATLTVLYYTGAMPFVIKSIGAFFSFVLETSPVENMSVAAGIFLEGVTAILGLRPYLGKMSKSQLFLVITSAYASLGGAYLAVLSTMGVSMSYLIPAMLVSAPATFAVCKLMVPETKMKPGDELAREVDLGKEEKGKYAGVMDAAQTGAMSMTVVVANIVVVAYVFFSYVEWVNHTLAWFGERVGVEGLGIETISSYVLYPVALAMGVEPDDCNRVATLLGYRIGVTNIVAIFKLTDLKHNRNKFVEYMQVTNGTGLVGHDGDDIILHGWNTTLKNGFLADRSEAIVTYSLCGFSSFMTVMILTGIMVTLVPHRKVWITRMSIPALIAGNIANCMTGCFASIFY